MEERRQTPLIFNLGTKWKWVVSFTQLPGIHCPLLCCSAHCLVTILTELSRPLKCFKANKYVNLWTWHIYIGWFKKNWTHSKICYSVTKYHMVEMFASFERQNLGGGGIKGRSRIRRIGLLDVHMMLSYLVINFWNCSILFESPCTRYLTWPCF
jgi:hypothetical protein